MSSVYKVQVGGILYDMSPAPTGILETSESKGTGNYYVSNDVAQASAASYTTVEKIDPSTDTNATIFGKLTSNVANIKYLYNRLGTTDISELGVTITGAINVLNTNKASKDVATTSADGLMASADKSKLDTIEAGATKYTLPIASASTLGGIKVGDNLTIDSDTGKLSASNTTYSAGGGITITNNEISNSGVRSIATGTSNGTISVNTNGTSANVAVYGLGTAAYKSIDYFAEVSHTHTKSQITDFPSSMPASDVYDWAKASTKPSYTYYEVGAAAASHSHDAVTTSANGFMIASDKSKLDGIATGATANKGTVTSVAVKMNGTTKGTVTESGTIDLGTVITAHQDISGKANTSGTYSGLNVGYADSAGSAPASDVYDWAKASTKPSYTYSEVGAAASSHTHTATDITSGTIAVARGGTGATTLAPAVGTYGARAIAAGTTDIGVNADLTTGQIYCVYE